MAVSYHVEIEQEEDGEVLPGVVELAQALEAEVADSIARHQERDDNGRPKVIRNGKARARKLTLGSGTIEVPFATVRLRQRVTKGAGSRRKGLLMAFQLLAMAERRWRRINGAQLIPLVRAGVQFSDGVQAEGRNAA